MRPNDLILKEIGQAVGYKSLSRYKHRGDFILHGIDLTGKRVLDVGCGPGAWCFWSVLNGASFAQGLEPEAAGSSPGMVGTFQGVAKRYGLETKVSCLPAKLEDFNSDQKFDIAISYASINHMDESAVQRLHVDPSAVTIYLEKLAHLNTLLQPGADVIVVDCGRFNLWNTFGMKNPLIRTIEFQKHQEPEVWIRLFEEAGYTYRDLRWSPLYPFGWATMNRFAQVLTMSEFTLRFQTSREVNGLDIGAIAHGNRPKLIKEVDLDTRVAISLDPNGYLGARVKA